MLGNLLDALKRLLPGRGPDPDDADAATGTAESESGAVAEPAYKCSICGTPAASSDAECSLCGSTDIVPADTPHEDADGGLKGRGPAQSVSSDGLKTPDDVLSDRDLLSVYREHWERTDDGRSDYRVSLPEGGVEPANSKGEVRELLLRHYGPPAEDDVA